MKLRNKKTGETGLVHCDATMFSNKIGVFIDNNHIDLRNPYKIYTSLAELNAEWEDYKPAEPLIKDEKIRKTVRAWADENILPQVEFEYIAGTGSIFKDGICGVEIGFYDDLKLTNRETYTIAELCGEEEE